MDTLIIKNASYLVTCNDKDEVLENASFYAEDGIIKEIGKTSLIQKQMK